MIARELDSSRGSEKDKSVNDRLFFHTGGRTHAWMDAGTKRKKIIADNVGAEPVPLKWGTMNFPQRKKTPPQLLGILNTQDEAA